MYSISLFIRNKNVYLPLRKYFYFGGLYKLGHVRQAKGKSFRSTLPGFLFRAQRKVAGKSFWKSRRPVSNCANSFGKRMGDRLSNVFSVLEIDVEDDHPASASSSSSSKASGKSKSNGKGSTDVVVVKQEKQSKLNSALLSENYKLPLVWIDLEMTGLDIGVDRILEIACIITDGSLTKSVEGPDLVIHQSKECLDRMGEWCQNHHAASGLTKKVLQSTITEREAEKQVIEFVKRNVGTYTPHLAGNSVYMDFLFLKIKRKPLRKKRNTEPWMISERAYRNSSTSRRRYLKQSPISKCQLLLETNSHNC
ncbi:oligoribonuclease-like isoform X2 [Durio zibethinus]|uniref:Oligoribonuclease-like isoform X2 n=1 Tax=Durio zibethinus TaxID=66656 RepID=A0A6P5ZKA7_DURZI|nr:oligoribonuclease-like isoform X2 [Durio zibethinus]